MQKVEKKSAPEKKILHRMEYHDQILNATGQAIIAVNKGNIITYMNQAAEKLVGCLSGEWIGRSVRKTFDPDLSSLQRSLLLERMQHGRSWLDDSLIRKKNGESLSVFLNCNPLFDAGGKYLGIVAAAIDNTERNRYIEELKLIHQTALEANRETDMDRLAELLGKTLLELNPHVFIAISLYDPEVGSVRVRTIHGIKPQTEKMIRFLGKDPRHIRFDPYRLDKVYSHYTSGKLIQVEKGLAELMAGAVPERACRALEKLMKIDSVHTVGFASSSMARGGAVFFVPRGERIESIEVIELLMAQMAGVIRRRQAEDENVIKLREFEIFNEAAVDRELEINRQRQEINELLLELGRSPRYQVVEFGEKE